MTPVCFFYFTLHMGPRVRAEALGIPCALSPIEGVRSILGRLWRRENADPYLT
jgi:hypothetical protein